MSETQLRKNEGDLSPSTEASFFSAQVTLHRSAHAGNLGVAYTTVSQQPLRRNALAK
jgi:hypothetical protein